MEASRFSPQMNRGSSGCLLSRLVNQSPPSSPTCLCGLTANTDLFVPPFKKNKKVLWIFERQRGGDSSFYWTFFFFLSFCDAAHLFNCCSRLSNGWDSGPVIEYPLTALPPLRLPALPLRAVPIPSITPLAHRVSIETYCTASGERKGDREMRL